MHDVESLCEQAGPGKDVQIDGGADLLSCTSGSSRPAETWLPMPIGVILLLLGLAMDSPRSLVIGGGLVALRFAWTLLPWDSW